MAKHIENNSYELHLDDERQQDAVNAYKAYLSDADKKTDDYYDFCRKVFGATMIAGTVIVAGSCFKDEITEHVLHPASDWFRVKVLRKEAKWAAANSDEDIVVDAKVSDVEES